MKNQLKNRHLLTLLNHEPKEIVYLLELAQSLKKNKKAGKETPQLSGKNIALIFEKTSTRTRCAFEVAAFDQGARVTFLDPISSQIGHKESISDTARVLGRFYDAIEYRGAAHEIVEQLAQYAGVPVFNGLTNGFHPTQALADILTMIEHVDKPINQISFAYVGDANNNVAHSLLIIAAKMGMHFKVGAPKAFWPSRSIREQCEAIAQKTGARLEYFEEPLLSVHGVDFIYTDVWVSMGEAKDQWALRIKALMPYQVNHKLMAAANNKAVKFMHCLPAFHNSETIEGQKLIDQFPTLAQGIEVTDEVFESSASIVFDQAENRMHAIKAIMVASLG